MFVDVSTGRSRFWTAIMACRHALSACGAANRSGAGGKANLMFIIVVAITGSNAAGGGSTTLIPRILVGIWPASDGASADA